MEVHRGLRAGKRVKAEIRLALEVLANAGGKGTITHPALILWSRRRTLKDIGITKDGPLYDDEAEIMEFCESVYTQALNRPKRR